MLHSPSIFNVMKGRISISCDVHSLPHMHIVNSLKSFQWWRQLIHLWPQIRLFPVPDICPSLFLCRPTRLAYLRRVLLLCVQKPKWWKKCIWFVAFQVSKMRSRKGNVERREKELFFQKIESCAENNPCFLQVHVFVGFVAEAASWVSLSSSVLS